MLLNSQDPKSERGKAIAKDIASRYGVNCVAVNCLELGEEDVADILKAVLYEFPMQELDLFLPPWVDALPDDHPIKAELYEAVRQSTGHLRHIREVESVIAALGACPDISEAKITTIDLGTGVAAASLRLPRELFYRTLSEQSGFEVGDDGDLMSLLTRLAAVKTEYDKVAQALKDVRETGYGIVVPGIDELKLEEPEIMKQGGRYGVRLKASAPSIHIFWNKQKVSRKKEQAASAACSFCIWNVVSRALRPCTAPRTAWPPGRCGRPCGWQRPRCAPPAPFRRFPDRTAGQAPGQCGGSGPGRG